MKFKFTSALFLLSIIFAVLSMQFSGALSQGWMDRTASAQVVNDNTALLKLDGFQNKSYDMSNKFASYGSITNNTNQAMKLTVTITPGYSNNKNGSFSIKLGTETADFKYNNSATKQVMLTLAPGQSIDAQASFDKNLVSATASFQFTATNDTGTYTIQLGDTAKTPRRITLY